MILDILLTVVAGVALGGLSYLRGYRDGYRDGHFDGHFGYNRRDYGT